MNASSVTRVSACDRTGAEAICAQADRAARALSSVEEPARRAAAAYRRSSDRRTIEMRNCNRCGCSPVCALAAAAVRRHAADAECLQGRPLLRRRLDRHHRDHRHSPRACSKGSATSPTIQVLSVPVTYASLKNKDIDVFLGNWMPTMEADRQALSSTTSRSRSSAPTSKARSTRWPSRPIPIDAGPQGLRRHRQVQGRARRQDLRHRAGQRRQPPDPRHDRQDDQFGLQGLQAGRVERAGHAGAGRARRRTRNEPIVFLGWEPHPMNTNFKMSYLTGGDDVFGPNFGGATVFTNVRAGYRQRMPERRQASQEPEVHPADGERDHGRDPERRQGGAEGRRGVAEGQSRRRSTPGSTA